MFYDSSGWRVSDRAGCPNGKFECEKPKEAKCSFKGCEPLKKHHFSFNVFHLGHKGRTLREKTTTAVCQGGNGTFLQLQDNDMGLKTINLTIDNTRDGLKLFSSNHMYARLISNGHNPCTVAIDASRENASTLHLNFKKCKEGQVAIESLERHGVYLNLLDESCHKIPQCHNYSIRKTVNATQTFMIPDKSGIFFSATKQDLDLLLIEESKSQGTSNALLAHNITLKCNSSQNWIYMDPNLRY